MSRRRTGPAAMPLPTGPIDEDALLAFVRDEARRSGRAVPPRTVKLHRNGELRLTYRTVQPWEGHVVLDVWRAGHDGVFESQRSLALALDDLPRVVAALGAMLRDLTGEL